MDPIRSLIELLQQRLPNADFSALQTPIYDLFARFELVAKADYEAHLAVLSSLEAQVKQLEERLKILESND